MGKPVPITSGHPVRKGRGASGGTETSKYPEEEKSTEIPKVAASEIGLALKLLMMQVKSLESLAIKGDSPVTDTS